MKYCLLLACLLLAVAGVAQQRRLEVQASRSADEATKRFVADCLCTRNVDELLPTDPELGLDSVRHIKALIRVAAAVKLAGPCDGVYYYLLRSEHWRTPTFRGASSSYYEYAYFVIRHNALTVFRPYDRRNRRKFRRLRPALVLALGATRTDSLKPALFSGYRQQ